MDINPREVAERIRNKIADLNDDLILAALAEVDVEVMVETIEGAPRTVKLRVWCSQEVR